MSAHTRIFTEGGYRYIEGVFQYSAGVAALDGHEIVRVRFHTEPPLDEGFAQIEKYLRSVDRPLSAFCACELRSPAPFTEAGFTSFNRHYVGTLERWGILDKGRNPVARSNVCPELGTAEVSVIHAFAYTRPSRATRPSFVISGSGEVPEGRENYRDHIVRRGDVSPTGLKQKAQFVLSAMEDRLTALCVGWNDTTATHVYTVRDIHPFIDMMISRGAGHSGITWCFARPPVVELEFEMDCRSVPTEFSI